MVIPRFHGALVWANLSDAEQSRIGAIALELIVAIKAMQATEEPGKPDLPTGESLNRAAHASAAFCVSQLDEAACATSETLDHFFGVVPSIPSLVGDVCESCGCTEHDACLGPAGPCSWLRPGLCSAPACAAMTYVPPSERVGLVPS